MKFTFRGKGRKSLVWGALLLLFSAMSGGCTNVSLKMDPMPPAVASHELPVRFKFSTITWSCVNGGLPLWLSQDKLSTLITEIKKRDPGLFADSDPKALPLTFQLKCTTLSTTNAGMALLAVLTGFTIVPGVISNDYLFELSVDVGEGSQLYSEPGFFKISDRQYVSLLPFYVFLMPGLDEPLCKGMLINDQVIQSPELQNQFLNLIYNLNRAKLRMMYDDKFGEPVTLLE